jgi:hypothetical protein
MPRIPNLAGEEGYSEDGAQTDEGKCKEVEDIDGCTDPPYCRPDGPKDPAYGSDVGGSV